MKCVASTTTRRGQSALQLIAAHQGTKATLPKEYQALFTNNGKPMVIVEADATISLANAEFERLSGYTKMEIEGKKSWTEFVARPDRKRLKEYHLLRKSDPMLAPRCFEFRFIDRRGKIKNVVLTLGQIPGTHKSMASLQDITDRRREEATRRVSEERYKTLFENSQDAIYITTGDGTYVDANKAALKLFGYTRAEMRKVNARELYVKPADARQFQQELEKKGFVQEHAVRLHKKDGTAMDCLLTVTVQRADDGGVLEYQGIIRDITEHTHIEEMLRKKIDKLERRAKEQKKTQVDNKLRQSEERFRRLVETMRVGLSAIDAKGVITYVNDQMCQILGYTMDEMIGCPTTDFHSEESQELQKEILSKRTKGVKDHKPYEITWVAKDGHTVDTIVTPTPDFSVDGHYAGSFAIITDITERKQAEEELKRHRENLGELVTERTAELQATNEQLQREITERKQMEQELRQSEERYRILIEKMQAGLSGIDSNFVNTYANGQFCKMLGYSMDEIIGRPIFDFLDEENSKILKDLRAKRKKGVKDASPYELTWTKKDGNKVHTIMSPTPTFDIQGHHQNSFAIITDITDRKQAEEKLKQNETTLRSIMAASPIGIGFVTDDRKISWMSDRMAEITGHAKEELQHKSARKVYGSNKEFARVGEVVYGEVRKGRIGQTDTQWMRKDGRIIDVHVSASALNPHDLSEGVVFTTEDITERKRAEEALRESEEQFKAFFNNSLDSILLTAPDGSILSANPAACRMFGRTKEELRSGGRKDLVDQNDPNLQVFLKERARTGYYQGELTHLHKDGTKIPCEISSGIFKDKDGANRTVTVIRDITDRKRAEQALKENENRLQAILDNSPVAITWADMDGNIQYINNTFRDLFGYTLDDIPTTDEFRRLAYPQGDNLEAYTAQVLKQRERLEQGKEAIPIEVTLTCKDGSTRHVAAMGAITSNRRMVIYNDISDRKRMEEALQENEKQLRALMDNAPVAVTWSDMDGNIQYLNHKHQELFGYTLDDIPTIVEWKKLAHRDPASREAYETQVAVQKERLAKGLAAMPIETEITCKDGSTRYISTMGAVVANRRMTIYIDITGRKEMEEELRESKEQLQTIMDAAPIPISWADTDKKFQYFNKKFTELFGYTIEEVPTVTDWRRLAYPDEAERKKVVSLTSAVKKAHDNEGPPPSTERKITCKDGSIRYVEIMGVLAANKLVAMYNDLTERKEMEENLRQNQQELQTLMDTSPVAITWSDQQGNIEYINRKFQELFGYAHEEIPTIEAWKERAHPDPADREAYSAQTAIQKERLKQGAKALPIETTIACKDGSARYVTAVGSLVSKRMMAIYTDITERKEMEDALKKSEQTLRLVTDSVTDVVWSMDLQGNFTYATPSAEQIFGYTAEEMLSLKYSDIMTPESQQKALDLFHRDVGKKTQTSVTVEIEQICKDGSNKWCEATISFSLDEHNRPTGMVGVTRDITERKEMEEVLRQSQQELQTLMDTSPVAIMWSDLQRNVVYINRKFQELFGYTLEEIPTVLTWKDRAMPDKAIREEYDAKAAIEKKRIDEGLESRPIETLIIGKDGSRHHVIAMGAMGANRHMVIFNDITERKEMEEQIRKSEELHRTLIETTRVGVSAINENGVIIYSNERLCDIWGYPLNEIMGHRVTEFLDEENVKILREQLVKRKGGGREPYEIEWKKKNGTNVPTILAPTPIFDAEGRYKGSYGFVTDITDRKRIEERLQRYADELERSNEEVKNFAYIVSHDLRVPLVNLKGYSAELSAALEILGANFDAVLPQLPDEKRSEVALALHEDIPEALEFITNSVSRMDSFINAVLVLSRLGRRDLRAEPIDMNALVEPIVEGMTHQIQEKGITMTIGTLPEVVADRTSMEQIVGNILGNAVKYLDHERPGEIEVTGEANGGETTFRIRDNGRGIASDDMDKVFAPFRRAGKQDTQGEGMGLSYVQTLVRRHNGRIWCESELGKGTTFYFTIATPSSQGADNA